MSEVTDSTLAAEAEDVDLLGPVDWIVVEFPGSRFDGTIFPILLDLEAQGTIRVLDLVVLKKDAEATLKAFDLSDEKPELRRLADRQSELASRDRRARALLHPERHDAERLQRCRESRDCRQRALDADVVTARGAAPDANAASARA